MTVHMLSALAEKTNTGCTQMAGVRNHLETGLVPRPGSAAAVEQNLYVAGASSHRGSLRAVRLPTWWAELQRRVSWRTKQSCVPFVK